MEGYRIWEIDEQTRIPKEIEFATLRTLLVNEGRILEGLDLINKTYAIRIGKGGLR